MNEARQIAQERRNHASQAHLNGTEHHGSGDHLSGHESSRQALEHVNPTYLQAQAENQKTWGEPGLYEGTPEPKEEEIAAYAYELWQLRSCQEGSPDKDWYCAVEVLRARTRAH
ncbi:DUF2934 domain-containing protein [Paludibaculum fermentans]|uniref:DUF2934 domain-containing protein n=1 Tax=Paludibaculum fermentans TaxID=1473598 RepID=UPI003EBC94AC